MALVYLNVYFSAYTLHISARTIVTDSFKFIVPTLCVTAIKLRKNYDKANTYVDKSSLLFQRGD